jgi:hypothetical protein
MGLVRYYVLARNSATCSKQTADWLILDLPVVLLSVRAKNTLCEESPPDRFFKRRLGSR